ncbi:hypothetical protein F0L17_23845 [Streptomyces sp. TRM43335]|uniref:Uncharacterized protein n=1 Tax=Streptomyces taklimakanensis TaxID=2569853 RepID=A0A6G2BIH8_9ACTN|nr:hypothetical protein [Streptomyces taklimakanensis]MTE22085.1 hypothetical protein [Streptomyces taklimakanensis]
MPTREQVLRLLAAGLDYEAVGERLGVSPGQAYLTATGIPADGGDAVTAEQARRPGVLSGDTQELSHAPSGAPDARESVHRWLRQRARSDEQMRRAARNEARDGPS